MGSFSVCPKSPTLHIRRSTHLESGYRKMRNVAACRQSPYSAREFPGYRGRRELYRENVDDFPSRDVREECQASSSVDTSATRQSLHWVKVLRYSDWHKGQNMLSAEFTMGARRYGRGTVSLL